MIETEAAGEGMRVVAEAATGVIDLLRPISDEVRPRMWARCERDPELEAVLATLDAELNRLGTVRGAERSALWRTAERRAGPYALALYFEIRRMDQLRLWGMPDWSAAAGES